MGTVYDNNILEDKLATIFRYDKNVYNITFIGLWTFNFNPYQKIKSNWSCTSGISFEANTLIVMLANYIQNEWNFSISFLKFKQCCFVLKEHSLHTIYKKCLHQQKGKSCLLISNFQTIAYKKYLIDRPNFHSATEHLIYCCRK